MAIIDQERGVIVVRIVYDGPPLSGKTTSIQSLSTILGKTSRLFSRGEFSGRTLYFDWMEYVGGYFRGNRIACQVVSVPGQQAFQEHRHLLLRSADVVVFVVDSSEEEIATALTYFSEVQAVLSQSNETVKVVIQANKQDKEHALTVEQIKQHFKVEANVVATIATLGKGIRETFVLAVRLAVERASILISKDQLPCGKPKISSGSELFALLQQQANSNNLVNKLPNDTIDQFAELFVEEEGPEESRSELTEIERLFELAPRNEQEPHLKVRLQSPSKSQKLPKLPDEEISSRWIWPLFTAQEMLEELFKNALRPRLQSDGTWFIEVKGKWRCFSRPDWCYSDSEQAHQALRLHISRHLRCSLVLTERRCIAVAIESEGQWRFWQILSVGQTLLAKLIHMLNHARTPYEVASCLRDSAVSFSKAYQQRCPFMAELTLDNFGLDENNQLIYFGSIDEASSTTASLSDLLRKEYIHPLKEGLTLPVEKRVIINELKKIEQKPSIITEIFIDLFNEIYRIT